MSRRRSVWQPSRQVSVKKTRETTCPKLYSCSPHAPAAFRIDALWITCVGMCRARARRSMSVWVVALGVD
jgi:hypothetical protein